MPPTFPFSLSGTSTSPSTNFRLSPVPDDATFSVSITRWKLFTVLVLATLSDTRSSADFPEPPPQPRQDDDEKERPPPRGTRRPDHARSMTEMRRAPEAAIASRRGEASLRWGRRKRRRHVPSPHPHRGGRPDRARLRSRRGRAAEAAAPRRSEQADEQQAQARWQAGVPHWGPRCSTALNELSLMLSNARDRRDCSISGGRRRRAARPLRAEALEGCTAAIGRLGAAPGSLDLVRREALTHVPRASPAGRGSCATASPRGGPAVETSQGHQPRDRRARHRAARARPRSQRG